MAPIEIWEKILSYIECPVELSAYRLVSKDWCKLIDKDLLKSNKIQKFVQSKINPARLKEFMKTFYPEHSEANHQDTTTSLSAPKNIWREVFVSWKNWNTLVNNGIPRPRGSFGHACAYGKFCIITNVTMWRHMAAIIGRCGIVEFFDLINGFERHWSIGIGDPRELVIQVNFWYCKGRLIAVLTHHNQRLSFWDVYRRTRITITCQTFATHTFSDGDKFYGIWKRELLEYTFDGCIVRSRDTKVRVPEGDNLDFSIMNMDIIIGFTGKTANMVKRRELMVPLVRNNNDMEKVSEKKYEVAATWDFWGMGKYSLYALANHDVLVCVSDNKMAVSVYQQPWVVYEDILKYFGGHINAISLHADVMIFGVNSGHIYVLKVNELKDLMELKMEQLPMKLKKLKLKGPVDCEPEMNLHVSMVGDNPFILAHTPQKIDIFEFEKII